MPAHRRRGVHRARRQPAPHTTRIHSTVLGGLNHPVFTATAADSYDADGNLVHSTDGRGIQQYRGYDALNRLTGVSDPSGLNTVYDYDGLGDATGQSSPDTGTTARRFDTPAPGSAWLILITVPD